MIYIVSLVCKLLAWRHQPWAARSQDQTAAATRPWGYEAGLAVIGGHEAGLAGIGGHEAGLAVTSGLCPTSLQPTMGYSNLSWGSQLLAGGAHTHSK